MEIETQEKVENHTKIGTGTLLGDEYIVIRVDIETNSDNIDKYYILASEGHTSIFFVTLKELRTYINKSEKYGTWL